MSAAAPRINAAHQPPIAAGDAGVRRALVLAGGGMRVAYQAGAVKALFDQGLRFSHADGASGGTINLAALMSGVTPDDLCARWRALPVTGFAALRPAPEYLRATRMKALGSADGMIRNVYPALGVSIERIRAATGIDASFNVCRFDDKTLVPLPQAGLDLARLVAAASLPIFMPAVQADGQTWTDAVWIKDANLLSCVERGARELWLIWCIGNTPVYRDGAFNQYVHMIEMSALGALHGELATIADINRRIAAGETVQGHREPIVVHVIKPEVPLPLDPDFFLGRIDAATLIDMGYRDARRTLRLGAPASLDPRATAMREPGLGVGFRVTMRGALSHGSAADTPLTVHASVHIEDLATFVADPQHRAELTGHIDFAPFGAAWPAESGRCGRFSPEGDPAGTDWVCELGLRHAGEDYCLAGRKRAANTPLHVTLHKGRDARGEIVGTGDLELGVAGLLRLLRALHASNAPTPRAGAAAVWRFLRFLMSRPG